MCGRRDERNLASAGALTVSPDGKTVYAGSNPDDPNSTP
jgi:hypothetical protein